MASKGRGATNKGRAYERKIAKALSEGFKTNVQRSAYSGAKRGIETDYNLSEVEGENGFVGDLFFPKNHPMSIFNYELKNHAKVKLANFFNNNGEIPSFLEQVTTDSQRLGGVGHSVPCLIVHVEREDDYVIFPYRGEIYKDLTKVGPTMITVLSYQQERTGLNYRYQMLITNLKTFMQIDPKKAYQLYKDYDYDRLNHHAIQHKEVNIKSLVQDIN